MVVYYDLGQNNFDRKYKKNLKKICRFKVYEMLGWMKQKLESRLPGEISITSYTQMTPPLQHKAKKN